MEWEAPDERPLVVQTDLWEDDTQRMTYEDACAADKPRDTDTLEGYLARISASVEGRYKRLPRMPHTRMSRVERDRQLQKLRGQIGSKTEVL